MGGGGGGGGVKGVEAGVLGASPSQAGADTGFRKGGGGGGRGGSG